MLPPIQKIQIVAAVAIAASLLVACGGRQLENCRFEEIEDAEVEFDPGDIDVERGEVEMLCSGETIDVTWSQFRRRLNVNPGDYKNRLSRFAEEINCVKEKQDSKQVLCRRKHMDEYEALQFSYDD